ADHFKPHFFLNRFINKGSIKISQALLLTIDGIKINLQSLIETKFLVILIEVSNFDLIRKGQLFYFYWRKPFIKSSFCFILIHMLDPLQWSWISHPIPL